MSNKAVLCIQVNVEAQLRLLEERHVEDYFALIERNQEYLHEWIAVEAYEGSVETLRAYVKQRLLQFVSGEGLSPGDLVSGCPGRDSGLSPQRGESPRRIGLLARRGDAKASSPRRVAQWCAMRSRSIGCIKS
jgi:hypothetical protein